MIKTFLGYDKNFNFAQGLAAVINQSSLGEDKLQCRDHPMGPNYKLYILRGNLK